MTPECPDTVPAEDDEPRQSDPELRLRYANLLAAVRATVQAHLDGEPDPLLYLEDELAEQSEVGETWSGR